MRFVRHVVAAAAVLGVLSGAPAAQAKSAESGAPAAQAKSTESGAPAAQTKSAPARITSVGHGPTLKVMPLGDSITWGVGTDGHDSYRTELFNRLGTAGLDVDFVGSQSSGTGADPDNEGHPGWTIDQIAANIDDWLATYEPDVILLHLGTNDMHVGTTFPEWRLTSLLDRIHEDRPEAQVFVAKLIGLGLTGHTGGQAVRTASFNRAIERAVAGRGEQFHLVDVSSVHGVDLYDRLHPNTFGYRRMAWSWYRALEPVLNDTGTAWPAWDNPARAATAFRCLGRAVTLPAYAKGCRSWMNRRPGGPASARVWQLPVRRSVAYRAGNVVKVRTTVQWITAP